MAQVFQNLIANALKFRGPNNAPKSTSARENGRRSGCSGCEDNGIGFKQQFAERIF